MMVLFTDIQCKNGSNVAVRGMTNIIYHAITSGRIVNPLSAKRSTTNIGKNPHKFVVITRLVQIGSFKDDLLRPEDALLLCTKTMIDI